MKSNFTTTLLVLLAVIVLIGAAPAFACGGCPAKGMGITLTDEQRAIVQSTRMEMINAGATREEMRDAMRALLTGFGIALPESCGTRMGCGHGTTPCGHTPGECDSSCVKPGGHSGSGGHGGGCHGGSGGHGSGGCHGGMSGDDASFSSINDNKFSPGHVSITKIIPNPFNATTEIQISGDIASGHVLDIYDMEGRVIRAIPINGNSVIWDGKNLNGQNVNTGTYFGRVRGTNDSQKIILMK